MISSCRALRSNIFDREAQSQYGRDVESRGLRLESRAHAIPSLLAALVERRQRSRQWYGSLLAGRGSPTWQRRTVGGVWRGRAVRRRREFCKMRGRDGGGEGPGQAAIGAVRKGNCCARAAASVHASRHGDSGAVRHSFLCSCHRAIIAFRRHGHRTD